MGRARRERGPGSHGGPGRGGPLTAIERQQRADVADALCAAAFQSAVGNRDETGVALVAVGGYGRRELAPHSDLDVVLVHADDVDIGEVASKIWYPLWDAGAAIDHSVRALSDVTATARADLRVALGLLDARHLAGDPSLTLQMRTSLLAQWRRDARKQLPELKEMVLRRGERVGELAHASVPDLKESMGGLRDATVLKALVATWLVDVPHADLERCRLQLLDVRDLLQEVSGRPTDRVAPEVWGELGGALGLADAEAAQRQVRDIGRRLTHLSRLTWGRVDAVIARPVSGAHRRQPMLERIAPGVAVSSGEVVLDRGAIPGRDALLLLRAAAEAAERDLILSPATAVRLVRECAAIPEPWSSEARNLFTRLLAAGSGLLAVWETLDETGGLATLLPEWEQVRLLPHASVVHRFTVDRHSVETCIEASRMIRRVGRIDVLMVAAILHDIGKGQPVDHSVAGEPIAAEVGRRMGFDPGGLRLVSALVRWHLLLSEVATTRDLEDPATIEHVAGRVRDLEMLELLEVLTEADARATSPKAWTTWRAGLVAELVRRVRARLLEPADRDAPRARAADSAQIEIPSLVRSDPARVDVRLETTPKGARVTVVSGDRVGLMAAAAGALAVLRVSVRAARAWVQEDFAVSAWDIDDPDVNEAILRQRLEAVLGGRLDPRDRLRTQAPDALEPSVMVRHEVSQRATVLEVRVDDRPGVIYLVCEALASLGLSVRSAHVSTLGPQAVDVFYMQESGVGALTDERSASAADAVRRALGHAATLDP